MITESLRAVVKVIKGNPSLVTSVPTAISPVVKAIKAEAKPASNEETNAAPWVARKVIAQLSAITMAEGVSVMIGKARGTTSRQAARRPLIPVQYPLIGAEDGSACGSGMMRAAPLVA